MDSQEVIATMSWTSRPLRLYVEREDGAFVKRHLSFIVAFGVCFYGLNTTVHGQQIKAESKAAIGGNSSRSTTSAISQEKVEELVRDAKRSRESLTTQQLENVALLGKKLDLNERQVLAALDILAEPIFRASSSSRSLWRSQSALKSCGQRYRSAQRRRSYSGVRSPGGHRCR